MRRLIIIFIVLGCLGVVYIAHPIYQFYAHRGETPMPPWGHVKLPEENPSASILHRDELKGAAETSLTLLKEHQRSIKAPGISAAVAIDGDIIWTGVSGWSDISNNKPMTRETQFRIGSTSKALTATLLARMVQDKHLTLDLPLSALQLGKNNPQWQQITPRHLSSHSSGLPHYRRNSDLMGLYRSIALDTAITDVDNAVLLFDGSKLLFAAGEQFSYSTYGTVLLSAVLQEVGEAPFQSLMQEHVLAPLNMASTLPNRPVSEFEEKAANLATFYWRKNDTADTVRTWRDVDLSHRLAGGGFISTSSDLVRLGSGFIDDGFISADTRAAFWSPQKLNNGKVNPQHYAVGWRVHNSDFGEHLGDVRIAHHGGVSRGAQSWLMVIPEYKMAVALNINCKTEQFSDFASVAKPIAKAFIEAIVARH